MSDQLCEWEVVDYQNGRPHEYRCDRAAKVDVDGHLLCTQHAKKARSDGRARLVSGFVEVAVDEDAKRARSIAEYERDRNRARHDRQAAYRVLLDMAIARLNENDIDASDLEAMRDGHPWDVPGCHPRYTPIPEGWQR